LGTRSSVVDFSLPPRTALGERKNNP